MDADPDCRIIPAAPGTRVFKAYVDREGVETWADDAVIGFFVDCQTLSSRALTLSGPVSLETRRPFFTGLIFADGHIEVDSEIYDAVAEFVAAYSPEGKTA